MSNNTNKLTINLFTVIAAITAIIFLQLQALNKKINYLTEQDYIQQEKQNKIKVNLQKNIPSSGFGNLISDLAFLQFIQYFGDGEARAVTGYPVVTEYFEAIVKHDPQFVKSYFVISTANSLFAARPEKTVELINQGLQVITPQNPGYPFFLWTYKATDEILFLGDLKAAKHSYKTAAEWARARQDDLGNEMAGRYDKTVNFLANDPDPTKAQFGAWMTALSSTQDQKTQDYILNKLKNLGAKIVPNDDGNLVIKSPKET